MDNGRGRVGAKIMLTARLMFFIIIRPYFAQTEQRHRRQSSRETCTEAIGSLDYAVIISRSVFSFAWLFALFFWAPPLLLYPDFGRIRAIYHTESTVTSRRPKYKHAIAPAS